MRNRYEEICCRLLEHRALTMAACARTEAQQDRALAIAELHAIAAEDAIRFATAEERDAQSIESTRSAA